MVSTFLWYQGQSHLLMSRSNTKVTLKENSWGDLSSANTSYFLFISFFQEVGAKSEIISKLEKEKATLIRDLFEARSKHKTNFDDTTFM